MGGGGVNRSNNRDTLDLQLFSSVSNPYTFILDGDYDVSSTIEQINLVDLSHYAQKNISKCQTVTSVPQSNLDYLQSGLYASNMKSMFEICSNLKTIPKLNIDTSNVTNMSAMFHNCKSLKSLDVSNFNTSNVTNMSAMFYDCNSLTSLNLSNFNTSNVTSMNAMFENCRSLTSLNLSNFNTSNVTSMNTMFLGCESLMTITGIIDMKSCTRYDYTNMFYKCPKLRGVKIKNPPAGFNGAGLNSYQYTIVS